MALRLATWTCAVLSALPAALATIPIVPSLDPFYTPPAGFASKAPGAILRTRTFSPSLLGLIPDVGIEGYQILFRTTSTNGTAIAGVTSVFKPESGAYTDRFVSFQTAYDSSASICEPSYNYQLDSAQVDIISDVESAFVQTYLAKGYIVSSADYEGPEAAFAATHLAGMVVLDSIRAVSQFTTLGFSTTTPMVVGAGYSGGAIAAGWAASLQSTYAPELDIKGWSQGGTPANLTGTLVYVDGKTFAGFLLGALDGLLKPTAYGAQLQSFVNGIITTYGAAKLASAEVGCAVEDILTFSGGSIVSTDFQSLGDALLYNATLTNVLNQLTMGENSTLTPTVPIYMYHASIDEIIPYDNATTLYDTWCADGVSVEFVTYENGGHFTTEIVGFPGAVEFVEAAFAGTVASGCSQSTSANTSVDPLALGLDVEPLLVDLINALEAFGNEDEDVIADPSILEDSL